MYIDIRYFFGYCLAIVWSISQKWHEGRSALVRTLNEVL